MAIKVKRNKDVNDYSDIEDMVKAHRRVLKSLIDKDMNYKPGEAVEINNGFGKQLNYFKIILEAYKIMGVKPSKKDLFLK
jgi:UDP-glucose 4-epimerase